MRPHHRHHHRRRCRHCRRTHIDALPPTSSADHQVAAVIATRVSAAAGVAEWDAQRQRAARPRLPGALPPHSDSIATAVSQAALWPVNDPTARQQQQQPRRCPAAAADPVRRRGGGGECGVERRRAPLMSCCGLSAMAAARCGRLASYAAAALIPATVVAGAAVGKLIPVAQLDVAQQKR